VVPVSKGTSSGIVHIAGGAGGAACTAAIVPTNIAIMIIVAYSLDTSLFIFFSPFSFQRK
jgi:hypothetical protein